MRGRGRIRNHGIVVTTSPILVLLPIISGLIFKNQILTVNTGTWAWSPSSFTYQWLRNGVSIGGATSASYTLVSADVGMLISVTVTATNSFGSTSSTSLSTTVIYNASQIALPENAYTPLNLPLIGIPINNMVTVTVPGTSTIPLRYI